MAAAAIAGLMPAMAQECPGTDICAAQGKDTLKVLTYNLRFGELASMSDFADFMSS